MENNFTRISVSCFNFALEDLKELGLTYASLTSFLSIQKSLGNIRTFTPIFVDKSKIQSVSEGIPDFSLALYDNFMQTFDNKNWMIIYSLNYNLLESNTKDYANKMIIGYIRLDGKYYTYCKRDDSLTGFESDRLFTLSDKTNFNYEFDEHKTTTPDFDLIMTSKGPNEEIIKPTSLDQWKSKYGIDLLKHNDISVSWILPFDKAEQKLQIDITPLAIFSLEK